MRYFQIIVGLACLTAIYADGSSQDPYTNPPNYPPPNYRNRPGYGSGPGYDTGYPSDYNTGYPTPSGYDNKPYSAGYGDKPVYPGPPGYGDEPSYDTPSYDTPSYDSYGDQPGYGGKPGYGEEPGYGYDNPDTYRNSPGYSYGKPCTEYGEKTPITGVCYAYFECVHGEQIYRQCGYGYSFNHYSGECEKDEDCHTACPYHIKPVPNYPSAFYLGTTKMNCAYGLVFDYYYCTCVPKPGHY